MFSRDIGLNSSDKVSVGLSRSFVRQTLGFFFVKVGRCTFGQSVLRLNDRTSRSAIFFLFSRP